MYCSQCGNEIDNNCKFCPYCGTKIIRPEHSALSDGKQTEESFFCSEITEHGNNSLETETVQSTPDCSEEDDEEAIVKGFVPQEWISKLSATERRIALTVGGALFGNERKKQSALVKYSISNYMEQFFNVKDVFTKREIFNRINENLRSLHDPLYLESVLKELTRKKKSAIKAYNRQVSDLEKAVDQAKANYASTVQSIVQSRWSAIGVSAFKVNTTTGQIKVNQYYRYNYDIRSANIVTNEYSRDVSRSESGGSQRQKTSMSGILISSMLGVNPVISAMSAPQTSNGQSWEKSTVTSHNLINYMGVRVVLSDVTTDLVILNKEYDISSPKVREAIETASIIVNKLAQLQSTPVPESYIPAEETEQALLAYSSIDTAEENYQAFLDAPESRQEITDVESRISFIQSEIENRDQKI